MFSNNNAKLTNYDVVNSVFKNLITYFEVALHFAWILVVATEIHEAREAEGSTVHGMTCHSMLGSRCLLHGVYIDTKVSVDQVGGKNK